MAGSNKSEVAVVGAGIVGVCCALQLKLANASVNLIDESTPGAAASFGNAGVFGTPYCLPAAVPGALRALPRLIFDSDSALVVRARGLPQLLPWFAAFAAACRADRAEENTRSAVALLHRSNADWDELLDRAGAGSLIRREGMLEVCTTETSLKRACLGWQLMRKHGFAVCELDAAAVGDLEPKLGPVHGGALLLDARHTIEPLELTKALFRKFEETGGTFVHARVHEIRGRADDKCWLLTEKGDHEADKVVIAAGIRSPDLAVTFGNRVPLVAERGYHVMYSSPPVEFRRPVTAVDQHVVVTTMATGLRMTTMAEFTSADAPASHERAERVFRRVWPLIPGITDKSTSRWVGSRPSTPDSLPVIGRAPRHARVYFAFGHGARGLTLAATTARLIAALINDRKPEIDVTPYRPDR
jgi:D-amino-acid dehydrogenase